MKLLTNLFSALLLLGFHAHGDAQTAPPPADSKAAYNADYAKQLGADKMGMRHYVMVILKTGPNKMPAGKARDEMFAGHFANINRLAAEGKLIVAGPFDGVDGWRGVFVFAVAEIAEAKALTETDPVLKQGEMIAEYHKWYGSAAMMAIPGIHQQIAETGF